MVSDMVPIAALEDAVAEVNELREALRDAREAVASAMRAVQEAQHVAIDAGRLNEALVAQYRNAVKSIHDGRHQGPFKDCTKPLCKTAKELSGTVARDNRRLSPYTSVEGGL